MNAETIRDAVIDIFFNGAIKTGWPRPDDVRAIYYDQFDHYAVIIENIHEPYNDDGTDWSVTFERLSALSERLGTRWIDVASRAEYNAGTDTTDVIAHYVCLEISFTDPKDRL